MKMFIFSIHDRIAGMYGNPYLANSVDEAKRAFKVDFDRACTDNPLSCFAKFIDDYDLCLVGEFDTVEGVLTSHLPEVIFSGRSLLKSDLEK